MEFYSKPNFHFFGKGIDIRHSLKYPKCSNFHLKQILSTEKMGRTSQIEWSSNPANSHHCPLFSRIPISGPSAATDSGWATIPPRITESPPTESGGGDNCGASYPPGLDAAHGRPLGHPWKNCGLTVGAVVRGREESERPTRYH